jgi:hypothetical protein
MHLKFKCTNDKVNYLHARIKQLLEDLQEPRASDDVEAPIRVHPGRNYTRRALEGMGSQRRPHGNAAPLFWPNGAPKSDTMHNTRS